uniref:Putative secreted protein n=1 Tax=Anopheles darlingi TaxID=43151 RepID=A0A2M4DMW5_ANODA
MHLVLRLLLLQVAALEVANTFVNIFVPLLLLAIVECTFGDEIVVVGRRLWHRERCLRAFAQSRRTVCSVAGSGSVTGNGGVVRCGGGSQRGRLGKI